MKKILLLLLVVVLLGVFIFLFIQTRPSGDIDLYETYFTDDSGQPSNNTVKVTFFGVSTLLFDDGETQILLDGFFSRPSMMSTLFTNIQSDTALIDEIISSHKLDQLNGIFVTHSHYDHSFDAAYVARKTGAILYGSKSTLNIGRGGDVGEAQLSLFQLNEDIPLGNFTVRVVPSIHSPGSALKDEGLNIERPLRQPASMKAYLEGGSFDFLIKHHGKSIYVKPSPNFIEGALDSLRADVVFVGIATVTNHPLSWQEKFYEENVYKLKPSTVIPLHWDDFFKPVSDQLVMLPRFVNKGQEDFDFFIEKTKSDNIEFKILQGTKSIVLFKE
jgi:L-ascorbate metabolism protein UlaG (beta-lactamase superfamily)